MGSGSRHGPDGLGPPPRAVPACHLPMALRLRRPLPWLLRLVWALLPLTAGPAFAGAFDDRSRPVQLAGSVGLWGVWAGVLLGTLVLAPVGLTAVRLAAPAALVASVLAAASGADGVAASLAVAWSAVAAGVASSSPIGFDFVNGPAYPNERRHLLRAPGPLLLGPLPLSWLVITAAPSAAALLLAARSWVAGGVLAAVGVPAAVLLARATHGLSAAGSSSCPPASSSTTTCPSSTRSCSAARSSSPSVPPRPAPTPSTSRRARPVWPSSCCSPRRST